MARFGLVLDELSYLDEPVSLDCLPDTTKKCSVDMCYRTEYIDELCKLHHDEEWYRQGMPNIIAWRSTSKVIRRCIGCGANMEHAHTRAQYCSNRCAAKFRVRRLRAEKRKENQK